MGGGPRRCDGNGARQRERVPTKSGHADPISSRIVPFSRGSGSSRIFSRRDLFREQPTATTFFAFDHASSRLPSSLPPSFPLFPPPVPPPLGKSSGSRRGASSPRSRRASSRTYIRGQIPRRVIVLASGRCAGSNREFSADREPPPPPPPSAAAAATAAVFVRWKKDERFRS